jgi:hypothetical protein
MQKILKVDAPITGESITIQKSDRRPISAVKISPPAQSLQRTELPG